MAKKTVILFMLVAALSLIAGFMGGRYDTLHRIDHRLMQWSDVGAASNNQWNECRAAVTVAASFVGSEDINVEVYALPDLPPCDADHKIDCKPKIDWHTIYVDLTRRGL